MLADMTHGQTDRQNHRRNHIYRAKNSSRVPVVTRAGKNTL